jgi:multidrug efflux pump subunit AcrA (membrane-fusion protein)
MEYINFKSDDFANVKAAAPSRPPTLRREHLQFAVMFLAVVTMLLTGCGTMGLPPAGPPEVEVVEVVQKDVPITKDWVATLDGFVNAQIRAQVAGLLIKQNYTNGAFVRKGQPLFEIDPRPFQAALDAAQGNLQQATADLQRAEATLGRPDKDPLASRKWMTLYRRILGRKRRLKLRRPLSLQQKLQWKMPN